MCGRFNLYSSNKDITSLFDLTEPVEFKPNYNVAPTQIIVAVRAENGTRHLRPMRWGLIPSWSDGPGKLAMFNARSETVATKPSFRSAFKSRRCLIPASGFHEWQQVTPKKKQPIFIRRADDGVMAFAGLWETWHGDGDPIVSCTIITTGAGEDMKPYHDRQPVILEHEQFDSWLDPATPSETLMAILKPQPSGILYAIPVGIGVGNVRNNGPELIERAG